MFPFPIATPQGCDIQTFYGVPSSTSKINRYIWNKPVGVSHVYMMLIGAGGNSGGGGGQQGGGSGAVTVWYGAAQHVPNNLRVQCGSSEVASEISIIRGGSGGLSVILQAAAGQGASAAVATVAPTFASSGFYKSTEGQVGVYGDQTTSSTTFLSGGAGIEASGLVSSNYGYGTAREGFFQMQPIIVGVGGGGNTSVSVGIGCGASGGGGVGGPGMVLIASW
jgi:hypothetical protein